MSGTASGAGPDVASGVRTVPLDGVHRALGASMTPFGGWSMPVRYGSDLAEHHAVRTAAGLFDVSHMGQLELSGPEESAVLDQLLVSRIHDLEVGRSRYTMLCDDAGGVIDDVIVTRLPDRHMIVANASNTDAVMQVLEEAAAGRSVLVEYLVGRILLALQGPRAADVLAAASLADRTDGAPDATGLRSFGTVATRVAGVEVLVGRTGYTGEDGFELSCAEENGERLWVALLAAGASFGLVPCGLAARDTLRLEAGLPLHGHELGPDLGPFESGFGRIVHLDEGRRFRGREALARIAQEGPARRVVGLIAEGRRAPRAGYRVLRDGIEVGVVTSGAPSPTLGRAIALAAVEAIHAAPGTVLEVDLRGTPATAEVVALPFHRRSA
jgi:aminomethyltransferase